MSLIEGVFMSATENSILAGQILFAIVYILICPALLLFLSGDWHWLEGWMFGVWFIILSFSDLIYLYREDPALLAEPFLFIETPALLGSQYGALIGAVVSLLLVARIIWRRKDVSHRIGRVCRLQKQSQV